MHRWMKIFPLGLVEILQKFIEPVQKYSYSQSFLNGKIVIIRF